MSGAVLDSAGAGLYNARALLARSPRAGFGAQVAQLVEHAIENRSVGGSIPPLGTTSQRASSALDPEQSHARY